MVVQCLALLFVFKDKRSCEAQAKTLTVKLILKSTVKNLLANKLHIINKLFLIS